MLGSRASTTCRRTFGSPTTSSSALLARRMPALLRTRAAVRTSIPWLAGWRDERTGPHRALADRDAPHRERPDGALQLALRPPSRRRVPAPDREHRHEP